MRKISMIAAAGLMALPFVSNANAADDGRVSYDKGVKVEAGDMSVRFNTQIQSRYGYTDYDKSESRGLEDKSSFSMRRVRLEATGSAMGGDVSYKLQNDFVGDTEDSNKKDSDLKDAWIQLNTSDQAMVRFGQFKIPYSLQELVSSSSLQMIDRSIVADDFAVGRQAGAMVHGAVAEGVNYYLSVSNGESDGEGLNRPGVDTNLLGAGMLTYSCDYDRSYEGDVMTTDGVGYTAGLGVTYGQATTGGINVDTTRVGGDLGLRTAGLSVQGEFHYLNSDVDGGDSTDDIGYYVQAGYFVVPEEVELAGRFAAINPDSKTSAPDEQEYGVVVNYYMMGHALKLQAGAKFLNTDPDGGESLTDGVYELQLAGYL